MLSQAVAQRLEHRKLAELTPYPRNPRRHSDAQIAQIAASIAQFGFNSPIQIDSQENVMVGHGRHLAALKLDPETVPAIVLHHLREIEKRAYLLADNKLAYLSGWEDETLASELAELRHAEIDLAGLGFSDDELQMLLAHAELPDAEADAQEQEILRTPAEPVTRAADVWCIGKHRLICGDYRDRDVVHRFFAGSISLGFATWLERSRPSWANDGRDCPIGWPSRSQTVNPKQQDARRILHNGPAPFYGSGKKAS